MGAVLRLEHANIMVYVTSRSYAAPRVLRHHSRIISTPCRSKRNVGNARGAGACIATSVVMIG
jgi:hypothetical protein